tara:strand:+ start:3438 stop:6197 length:2760 start_codon:yes stop_codon:yes gene_type:complete
MQLALAGAKNKGAEVGQGIGQKFAQDMMANLDGAEDYEQAINALRGDERPLEARYEELGGIVGIEDAEQTPESVLALVQPAIMMTEEGAMDSGIGGLMQELTSGVGMEGPMEEGVGSLMMASQPAPPPMPPGQPPMGPPPTALGPTLNGAPQGFAVGGAVNRFRNSPVVQNFATGTDVTIAGSGIIEDPLAKYANYKKPEGHLEGSLQKAYDERLKLYEKVGGRDQASDKAQFWAQMAQLGFNLASPPPELRGRSPAEALAAAAKVPFANIAQLGASAAEGKRATKFAALQAAEASETSRRKQLATSELDKQRAAIAGATTISGQQHDRKRDESGEAAARRLQIRKENIQKELAELAGVQGIEAIDARAKYTKEIANLNNAEARNLQYIKGSQFLTRLRITNAHEIGMATTAREQMSEFQNATLKLKTDGLALQKKAEDRMFRHGSANLLLEDEKIKYQQDYRKAVLEGNEQKQDDLVKYHISEMLSKEASAEALAEYRKLELDYKKEVLGYKQAALNLGAFGKSFKGKIVGILTNTAKLELYAQNRLSPQDTAEMNAAITYWGEEKTVWNSNTSKYEKMPGNLLSREVLAAMASRENSGTNAVTPTYSPEGKVSDPALSGADSGAAPDAAPDAAPSGERARLTLDEITARDFPGTGGYYIPFGDTAPQGRAVAQKPLMPNLGGPPDREETEKWLKITKESTTRLSELLKSGNLEDGWGLWDAIQSSVGWAAGHWHDWASKDADSRMARGPAEAAAIMGTVNETFKLGLRSMVSGRLPQEMIKDFEKTLPTPNKLLSDSDAADKFLATHTWLETKRKTAEDMISNPPARGHSATELKELNRELIFFTQYGRVYRTGYENMTGKSSRLSPLENAPMTIFNKEHPDYNLQGVHGYDPNEHKAAKDRGEDYRAELKKRRGAN